MVGTRHSTGSSSSVSAGRRVIQKVTEAISKNDHALALERLDDFKVHAATTFHGQDATEAVVRDQLRLQREAAEHGVMISAATRDEDGFERPRRKPRRRMTRASEWRGNRSNGRITNR